MEAGLKARFAWVSELQALLLGEIWVRIPTPPLMSF